MEYRDTAIGFALARTFEAVHADVRETFRRPFGTELDYERPAPPAAPVTYVRQGGNADDPRELERTVRVSDFVDIKSSLTEFSSAQLPLNCRCVLTPHDDTAHAMRYVMDSLTEDMAKAYGVPVERLTTGAPPAPELSPYAYRHTTGAGQVLQDDPFNSVPLEWLPPIEPVYTPGQTLFHARTGHPPAVWEKSSGFVRERWESIAAELAEKEHKAMDNMQMACGHELTNVAEVLGHPRRDGEPDMNLRLRLRKAFCK